MRPFHLALLLALVSAPLAAAPAQPQAGKGKTGMFRGAYDAPKDPKYKTIYEQLKKDQALERFSGVLAAIKLPKPLVLKFAGCDGTSNAWYEPADGTVTFCYEYVAEIQKGAEGSTAAGIPFETAWQGAVVFVLLHETGHALFDLL
ncbi:MAG: DUF4344 domain-containing metallopeptidase, partial [Myxococcales bacterium]